MQNVLKVEGVEGHCQWHWILLLV